MTITSLFTRPVSVALRISMVAMPSIWLDPSRFQQTFMPARSRMRTIISTVDVLPLEPVTATTRSGSFIRAMISGQIFSAS